MIIKCRESWIFISVIFMEISVITNRKLEGYGYPVYTTEACPTSRSQWKSRSMSLNCTDKKKYMCIPNDKLTTLLEFCYKDKVFPIEKGICLILNEKTSNVTHYNCSTFESGCPRDSYWSNEIYKHPNCLSIGIGCFNSEPGCPKERCTAHASTEIPKRTSKDMTHNYTIPSIPSTTMTTTSNTLSAGQKYDIAMIIALELIIILLVIVPIIKGLCGTCTDAEDYFYWHIPCVKQGQGEHAFEVENVHIYLVKGDITDVDSQAIVNSTNKKLDLKEGQVSRKLLEKAGDKLQEECSMKVLEMEKNKIVDTNGYKLNTRIIHILCPRNIKGWIERLEKAFERANDLKCFSIAMPLVGTGNANVGYDEKTMCKVILTSVFKFKPWNGSTVQKEINIVIFDDNKFKACYEYFMKELCFGRNSAK